MPYQVGSLAADAGMYTATKPVAIIAPASTQNYQSIPNATYTKVSFLTTEADTGVACGLTSMVGAGVYTSSGGSTSYRSLFCRAAGVYSLHAAVCFDVDATGSRRTLEIIRVWNSGTTQAASVAKSTMASSVNTYDDYSLEVNTTMPLTVGDELWVRVYHSAGNSLNLQRNSGQDYSRFSMTWVSPTS